MQLPCFTMPLPEVHAPSLKYLQLTILYQLWGMPSASPHQQILLVCRFFEPNSRTGSTEVVDVFWVLHMSLQSVLTFNFSFLYFASCFWHPLISAFCFGVEYIPCFLNSLFEVRSNIRRPIHRYDWVFQNCRWDGTNASMLGDI